MSDERVYLVNKATKQGIDVPNDPDVLKDYADRNWLPEDRPGPVPFVPSPDGQGAKYLDPKDYQPAPVSAPDPPKNKRVN